MPNRLKEPLSQATAWIFQERHKQWCAARWAQGNRFFTAHPHSAGESYWQHLWFTFCMSAYFLYVMVVLLIHGIFPFLFERTGSRHIENLYRIMKSRIPKARRDEIDIDYSV